jgi:hypothetical protein
MNHHVRILASMSLLVMPACRTVSPDDAPPPRFRSGAPALGPSCIDGYRQVTMVDHGGIPGPVSGAIADMNGDGRLDIVVIGHGKRDESPIGIVFDPLTKPTLWQSKTRRPYVRAALGDVDGDGVLDLAASICDSSDRDDRAVDIYLGEPESSLPDEPSLTLAGGCSPDVAFGDVDADGDLDLAVATLDYARNDPSEQLVYFNEGGRFSPSAHYRVEEEIQADGLEFGDIDGDGLLDLVFTATTPAWGWVIHGEQDERGAVMLGSRIDTVRRPEEGVVHTPTLRLLPERGWIIAGHSDHLCEAEGRCEAPVVVWDHHAGEMRWQSNTSGMTGAVALADLDGDGNDDLVANRWMPPKRKPHPGPLEVYCGSSQGFAAEAVHLRSGPLEEAGVLTHAILFDNLDPADEPEPETHAWAAPRAESDALFPTINLPAANITRIVAIERDGLQVEPGNYRHTPGSSWLTVHPPLRTDEKVTVTYVTPELPDIVIIDYQNDEEIMIIQHHVP